MVTTTLEYHLKNGTKKTISFNGTVRRTLTMEAQFVRVQNKLKKIMTYVKDAQTIATHVITDGMRNQIKEMMKAPYVAIKKGTPATYTEITIIDCDIEDKLPLMEIPTYYITYIVQDEEASNFSDDDIP